VRDLAATGFMRGRRKLDNGARLSRAEWDRRQTDRRQSTS
jgi:hypothetical protein